MIAKAIPVLMYHHVKSGSDMISISPENFESHLRYLSKNGFCTLSLDEFLEFKNGKSFPKKSVVLTFDDGWLDNFVVAFPLLQKYNVKANIFVATDFIERASNDARNEMLTQMPTHSECKRLAKEEPSLAVCNWHDLQTMIDSGLVQVECHSHSHDNEGISLDEWKDDLTLSRMLLKNHLGVTSKHLCWPRGKYNKKLMELALHLGFEALYTTKRGVNTNDQKSSEIKRLSVKDKDEKWLSKTLSLFSSPIAGRIYAMIKPD